MNVDFIELITTDLCVYEIPKDNLLECNIFYDNEFLENCNEPTTMCSSVLIIVKNYNDLRDFDDEKFDISKKNIMKIITHKDNEQKECFVNLTNEFSNDNQINCLDGEKLYITIN